MTSEELKVRTKQFALDVIRLVQSLPHSKLGEVIGRQVLRSCTSVAANYRSACRARSRREFIAKMGIVEEEADETAFWLEVMDDAGIVTAGSIASVRQEANQLLAITVASIRTARRARFAVRTRTPNPQSAIRSPQCS